MSSNGARAHIDAGCWSEQLAWYPGMAEVNVDAEWGVWERDCTEPEWIIAGRGGL